MGAAGVERIVYLGALGVRDDPRRHLARSKALADEAVRVSGLHRTVLRPSLMWGERDGFFNIVTSLARPSVGVIAVPARQSSLFRPFWVGDLATMVTMTLAEPSTGGRVFELGGPEHWTYREVVDEVLRATGRRRLVLPVRSRSSGSWPGAQRS